jgi:hypothetical protein
MRRRDVTTGLLAAATPLLFANRASAATCTAPCFPPLATEVGVIPSTGSQYPPYNVLRYGADPTGATSSLTAFSNAFTSAMAVSPHAAIYIPAGTYLIPSPGLTFSGYNDVRFYGDGPGQSVLQGDTHSSYTILKITHDLGTGTSGNYISLSDLSILNGSGGSQAGLFLADYNHGRLENLGISSSGISLLMEGMSGIHCSNLNVVTAGTNAAGSSALYLGKDSGGYSCGPLTFDECEFNGQGSITDGGAVYSIDAFGITFIGCVLEAFGPNLVTVVEVNSDTTGFAKADITLIGCYSESSYNTSGATAYFIRLGATSAPNNFTMIGGTFNTGNGPGTGLKYGIFGNTVNQMTIINTSWAGFITAAITYGATAATQILAVNNTSGGTGSAPVFDPSVHAPSGGTVPYWSYPPQSTGWGTPTGGAAVLNFPGASATLLETSTALAAVISALRTKGFLGA